MKITGQRFLDLRNQNILPLISYGILKKDVKFWDFKSTLFKNIFALEYGGESDFSIEIDKGLYYNALMADVELYYLRSVIQYCDFIASQKKVSEVWSFVSYYYYSFFTAICLLKINGIHLTHLTSDQTSLANNFYAIVTSNTIRIRDGDYIITIDPTFNNPTRLKLKFRETSKGGIHKHCWLQIEQFLRIFNFGSTGDESTISSMCIKIINKFKPNFPSELRNKLNYGNIVGVESISNIYALPEVQLEPNKILKNLFDCIRTNSANDLIFTTINFTIYLNTLFKEFYNEYSNRSRYGKDFQTLRQRYLAKEGIVIPDLGN